MSNSNNNFKNKDQIADFKQKWIAVNKRSKKTKNRDNVITFTLKELINDKVCPYDLVGRCQEYDCTRRHLNASEQRIQYYAKDPSKIRSLKSGIEKVKQQVIKLVNGTDIRPYFTTCLFCLKGLKCNNISRNRFIELNVGGVKFKVCYPDINNCQRRITCGFHIDISVEMNTELNKIYSVNFHELAENFIELIPHTTHIEFDSTKDFPALSQKTDDSFAKSTNNDSWASLIASHKNKKSGKWKIR